MRRPLDTAIGVVYRALDALVDARLSLAICMGFWIFWAATITKNTVA